MTEVDPQADGQSKSDRIRTLAAQGLSVGDIARRLGIRYQHAYNVLRGGGGATSSSRPRRAPEQLPKPPLTTQILQDGGFGLSGKWTASASGELTLVGRVSQSPGVYAFAEDGLVLYLGVSNMGLRKRLYFYSRPGVSQKTNIRVRAMLLEKLEAGREIELYTIVPSDLVLNGMLVSGAAGLEHGLIRTFSIPWNVRGA